MFAQQGERGELRAGPFLAARFGRWTLERPDDVLCSDVAWARVEDVQVLDTFRWAHEALDLWLDCKTAWWVWHNVVSDEGRWRTLGGPPEVRIT